MPDSASDSAASKNAAPDGTAPRRHLVIGTPCYGGQVTHVFMLSMLKLQQACLLRGITLDVLLLAGDALVSRARNSIATQFLDHPAATHLLFIDADIGFEPDAVFRLLDFDADFAGGMYPLKALDWDRARAFAARGEDLRRAALNYVTGFDDPARIESVGGFARAKVIGNGFMMLKRRVFQVIQERHPELRFRRIHASPDLQAESRNRTAFFDPMIDADGYHLPEDYAFCERWRAAGGAIFVDLQSRLTHVGPYQFVGDTSHMLRPAPGMASSPAPGPAEGADPARKRPL